VCRMGSDGADFPTSTFMLQQEEETNRLVESIWTASCPVEYVTATREILGRSLVQQLDNVESKGTSISTSGDSKEDKGGLPIMELGLLRLKKAFVNRSSIVVEKGKQ
jgi:hypothetical protein